MELIKYVFLKYYLPIADLSSSFDTVFDRVKIFNILILMKSTMTIIPFLGYVLVLYLKSHQYMVGHLDFSTELLFRSFVNFVPPV